jgi:hypothetical protein
MITIIQINLSLVSLRTFLKIKSKTRPPKIKLLLPQQLPPSQTAPQKISEEKKVE